MIRIPSRSAGLLAFLVLLVSVEIVACASAGSQDENGKGSAGGVPGNSGTAGATTAADGSTGGTTGIENCIKACNTFTTTGCSTRAADFCNSAQQNCHTRYDASPACRAQVEAMDACSASQPASNFICPLGTSSDPVRPYRVSQDVCVREAQALTDCIEP
jgi:hypothetical protein